MPTKRVWQTRPITPAQFVRQHILVMSPTALAAELGVATSIVSRYVKIPEHHHKKVQQLARQRKRHVEPAWFDAVPFLPGVPNAPLG